MCWDGGQRGEKDNGKEEILKNWLCFTSELQLYYFHY